MNITEQMYEMEKDLREKEAAIQKNIVAMIEHWSKTFGAPIKESLGRPSQFRENLSYSLIHEELEEFFHAQNANDIVEIQDALGDILWVTIRAMMEYGINPLETIQEIYKSNMSKLDNSLEDALKSIEEYEKKGVNCYYEKVSNNKYIIKNKLTDKILKSHKFVKPQFKST